MPWGGSPGEHSTLHGHTGKEIHGYHVSNQNFISGWQDLALTNPRLWSMLISMQPDRNNPEWMRQAVELLKGRVKTLFELDLMIEELFFNDPIYTAEDVKQRLMEVEEQKRKKRKGSQRNI